ncbi:MAG TPA: sigma 54-interacting transcriptional regulator [Planctomycetota bacterium]|nr:sigma 54-interacting transcriptional regulator [Planctomycetota bacterium]
MERVKHQSGQIAVLDDPIEGRQVARMLDAGGVGPAVVVDSFAELGRRLDAHACDLVVVDPVAAGIDPVELASRVSDAEVPMLLLGESAPPADEVAVARFARPLCERSLLTAARSLRATPPPRADDAGAVAESFATLIGDDPALRRALTYAATVAASNEPVLITGETGTGKDLVAEAIHRSSGKLGEFVAVNVAGFDDTLFSDTLFGHRKGAFTGATDPRLGLVLRASTGTLFLDEIGDLSLASQVKLLRLLEDGSYFPLGADVAKRSTARVIAATSVSPRDLARGSMRVDLFYRLRVHQVHLPPLRERLDDLPLLCAHFLHAASRALGRRLRQPAGLIDVLRAHSFPGNVRELRAVIYDAAACARGEVLDLTDVRRALAGHGGDDRAITFPARLPSLEQVQELLIAEALRRADGNQASAARLLGITRQGLNKRLGRRDDDG